MSVVIYLFLFILLAKRTQITGLFSILEFVFAKSFRHVLCGVFLSFVFLFSFILFAYYYFKKFFCLSIFSLY